MELKRLKDQPHSKAVLIRYRQNTGKLKEYKDKQGYLCYNEEEFLAYVPSKNGRKPKTLGG